MKTGTKLTAAVLLLFVLSVYGCRDTTRQEQELTGTWHRNVATGTGSFVGLLTLGRDGSFSFTYEGNAVGHEKSEGRYRLSGRDIKFENKSCKGIGRYRFLIKGQSLSFIPLADGCARRKTVLAGEWQRRETAETETN